MSENFRCTVDTEVVASRAEQAIRDALKPILKRNGVIMIIVVIRVIVIDVCLCGVS